MASTTEEEIHGKLDKELTITSVERRLFFTADYISNERMPSINGEWPGPSQKRHLDSRSQYVGTVLSALELDLGLS